MVLFEVTLNDSGLSRVQSSDPAVGGDQDSSADLRMTGVVADRNVAAQSFPRESARSAESAFYSSSAAQPSRYHDWIFSTAQSSGKVWNAWMQSVLSRESTLT
jgi:hypothetical protein